MVLKRDRIGRRKVRMVRVDETGRKREVAVVCSYLLIKKVN